VQPVESLGREAQRFGSILGRIGSLCDALLSMGLICAGDNEQSGKRVELDVKVGDRVMYAKYAGSEVKIDEVEYLILSEKDILAVVGSNGSN